MMIILPFYFQPYTGIVSASGFLSAPSDLRLTEECLVLGVFMCVCVLFFFF